MRMKSWQTWLIIGLATASTGGISYYGWEEWNQRENMEKLAWQTARANRELTQHTDWIERLDNLVDAGQKTQETISATLRQQSIMLGSITGAAQRHWRLQEAEYLLELAHQHLIMRSDLRGTESLLLTADAILRQLNEPTLANVRTALAGDIARLRASEEPDVVGLHGRLTALIDLLDEVPLRTPAGFAAHSTATALATEEDKRKSLGWLERLRADLTGLVKVHKGKPVEPLVPPEQSVYVYQNMRLMLEQARSALLRGLQPAYRESLKRAGEWLRRYYLIGSVPGASMRDEIANLLRREVGAPLPDITRAIYEIREAVNRANVERERASAEGHSRALRAGDGDAGSP